MMTTLIISNIVLWLAVLALLAGFLALARQVGVLFERVAPMGALMIDSGPEIGDVAPSLTIEDLDGVHHQIGGQQPLSQLLFFLSPTCPVCKKLLPILVQIQDRESSWLQIAVSSDGDVVQHRAFRDRTSELSRFPYLLSTELGMAFRIGRLPYAVLIDAEGRVAAKGLVNSREQVESLFTAKELGVKSIQDFAKKTDFGNRVIGGSN